MFLQSVERVQIHKPFIAKLQHASLSLLCYNTLMHAFLCVRERECVLFSLVHYVTTHWCIYSYFLFIYFYFYGMDRTPPLTWLPYDTAFWCMHSYLYFFCNSMMVSAIHMWCYYLIIMVALRAKTMDYRNYYYHHSIIYLELNNSSTWTTNLVGVSWIPHVRGLGV